MGSSPKGFSKKLRNRQREVGTTNWEKIDTDSSFLEKHENDVTGKKRPD